jgi:peptide/nickel transport system substrate-binding protein
MMKRIVLGLLVATALGGMPAAVQGQAQSTLRIGLAEDPDMLDPTLTRTFAGRFVFAGLCDKLFDLDENLAIVPQIALSHETSADGKTVTLKLRPGVRFHDGEPVDAEAVRFSLDRHLNLQNSMRRSELAVVDRIDVVDPLTVRMSLKTPFAPLVAQLTDRAGIIVSPKAVKDMGDKFGQAPVCAGPYKFKERVPQDRIVLEKFQDYWNKENVHIDRLVYLPIQDGAVRFVNLKAGQLDIIERLLATDAPEVRASKNLKLATAVALGWEGILFNTGKGDASKTPLGQDARVRQAFDLAIDRDAINQVAFNGEFVAGNQWVSPDNPWYQAQHPVPKRDVARAKQLLREAGVTAPVPVDLVVPNNPELRQVAELLQAMTGEAGFALKLRVTEFATSIKEVEDGRFQAYLFIWSGRTDPDGNIYSFSRTGGVFNWGPYSNPAVDALLDEARTLTPFDQRKAAYGKAADILLKEGSFQYLYHRRVLIAHTARLEGYKQIPDGLIRVVGLRLK